MPDPTIEELEAENAELRKQLEERPVFVRFEKMEIELPPFGETLDNLADLMQFISESDVKPPEGWKLTRKKNRHR